MAYFNSFWPFDEAHGHPQKQFSSLCFSKPTEDIQQQISKYPLLVDSPYDRDNVVGRYAASAYHHQNCFSNITVDCDTKAIRGFEYSLARPGVRKVIIDHPAVFSRVLLPSLETTHERVQENRNAVLMGEKRGEIEERKEIVDYPAAVFNQIIPSSSMAHERVQDNRYNFEWIGAKRRKIGERKVIKSVVVKEPRWIKHYCSSQRILLVGEGDFSFSACLAMAFGIASNMIATSLNSEDFLRDNYHSAVSNIEKLTSRGCKVMHGIDATKMVNHISLQCHKFDRIVFNFPFAGFFKDRPRDSVLRHHRRLVSKFLQNAKEMISEDGEIHISHKSNGIHKKWNLESIASSHGLRLIEAVKFKLRDYPGYNTKRGFGGDDNFHCYPSKTFKFGLKMV